MKQSIQAAIDSGIEPITMRYKTVKSCESGKTFALLIEMVLNSTELGELKPDSYEIVADRTVRSEKLSIWGITYAIRALQKLKSEGIEIDFITLRCPARAASESFARTVERLFIKSDFEDNDKICLVFPNTLLFEAPEDFKEAFSILRRLNIKTMLSNFGEEYCPVMRFPLFSFDYVTIDSSQIDSISVSSFTAIESLITMIKNFGATAIAIENNQKGYAPDLLQTGFLGYISKESFKSLPEVIQDLKQ